MLTPCRFVSEKAIGCKNSTGPENIASVWVLEKVGLRYVETALADDIRESRISRSGAAEIWNG